MSLSTKLLPWIRKFGTQTHFPELFFNSGWDIYQVNDSGSGVIRIEKITKIAPLLDLKKYSTNFTYYAVKKGAWIYQEEKPVSSVLQPLETMFTKLIPYTFKRRVVPKRVSEVVKRKEPVVAKRVEKVTNQKGTLEKMIYSYPYQTLKDLARIYSGDIYQKQAYKDTLRWMRRRISEVIREGRISQIDGSNGEPVFVHRTWVR